MGLLLHHHNRALTPLRQQTSFLFTGRRRISCGWYENVFAGCSNDRLTDVSVGCPNRFGGGTRDSFHFGPVWLGGGGCCGKATAAVANKIGRPVSLGAVELLDRFAARRQKACGRCDVDVRDEQPLFTV